VNFSSTPIGTDVDTGLRYTPGAQYMFRAQVSGVSPTTIKLKAWPTTQAEPSAWGFSQTDSTLGPQVAGSVLLGGKHTTGLSSVTIGFDTFWLTDLGTHRYPVVDNHCTPAQGCPISSPSTFTWNTSNEIEGAHTFTANAVDPFATDQPGDARHAVSNAAWTVKLDRTLPDDITLSGDFWDTRGQAFAEDKDYTLNMSATDGPSGITSLTVDVTQGAGAPIRMYADSQPTAPDGSPMSRSWTVRPSNYAAGTYTVTVTATDKAGNPRTKSFDVTVPPKPVNTAAPAVTGQPVDAQSLSSTTGAWTGPGLRYTYQWQHCDAQGATCSDLAGETEPAMTLRSEDVGTTVRVKVAASNGGGTTIAYSAASPAVASVAPAMVFAPEVSGKVLVGQELSAVDGVWSGSTPITHTYQWLRCPALLPIPSSCTVIPGATAPDYTPVAADSGLVLRVRVGAVNASGSALAATADSDPTDPIGSYVSESTDTLTQDPPPPSASELLATAVRFRTENGLNTDPAYIQGLDARADLQDSRDYFGVSLDRYEQRDVELRNDITDGLGVIETYGTTTASASYAGYYIDGAHGAQVYIGFTSNADANLTAIRGLFAYPMHLHTFTATYTQQQLYATQDAVEADGEAGTLAAAGVQWVSDSMDVQANRVAVEVSNPSAAVASTLATRYGNSVVMRTAVGSHRSGHGRTKRQAPKGGLDIYNHPSDPTSRCTLGYIGDAPSFNSSQRAPAFTTAGHCSDSWTYRVTPQDAIPTMDTKEDWHQGERSIGETSPSLTKNSSRPCSNCTVQGKVKSDAVTIPLRTKFDPQAKVFITRRLTATVDDWQQRDGMDRPRFQVCASLGRGSHETKCGEVISDRHYEQPEGHSAAIHEARVVDFSCPKGDSGSPVFHYSHKGTSQVVTAVGIVAAETNDGHCVYSAIKNVAADTQFRPKITG
jgi:hypothetical protein